MATSSSLTALLAPTVSVGTVSAQGGVYSSYESNFSKYAAQHWSQDGAAWDQADYYDRAEIFYNWYNRTGDTSYLTKANALAVNYRDNYLKANDYSPSAHWSQIAGVALHYLATGDAASKAAVGKVADSFAVSYYLDNLGNRHSEMDNRIQARTLEAFLYAKKIGATSAAGNDWDSLLHSSLTKILSAQDADGAYRFDSFGGYVKPFMVGMLNDTLIDYYTMYDADPRILTAVKKSLDWLWSHVWDEKTQSFKYLEGNFGGETSDPAPDVNNMITSGFGWVYKMTGDSTYKERGDKVFAGGVNGSWLDGSKQFNEQYTSSLKYLAYTLGDATASPTPSPTPTPTLTPSSTPSSLVKTTVSHTLAAGEKDLAATGSASVSLTGNTVGNAIDGNDAKNKISGKGGVDTLFGHGGNDTFIFDTKPNGTTNYDKIVDFESGADKIWLDNSIFTKLGAGTSTAPHQLNSAYFTNGTKAKDANDYIIYDKNTGKMFYDADGSGKGAAVHFATFLNHAALTAWDIQII